MTTLPSADRLEKWLHRSDTGLSSGAIFHYMTLGVRSGHTPSDSSDLGRCVRLLDAFPEWQARMPEMARVSDDWAALMSIWDELVAAYREDLARNAGKRGGEWRSHDMLSNLWWVKGSHGFMSRRNHGFKAQETPTRSAETTGSVPEGDGGSVGSADAPTPSDGDHHDNK